MILPDRQQILRNAAIAHQTKYLSRSPYLAVVQGYNADRGQIILRLGNGKIGAQSLSNGSAGYGTEVFLLGDTATHQPSQPLPLSPVINLPVTAPLVPEPQEPDTNLSFAIGILKLKIRNAAPEENNPQGTSVKETEFWVKVGDRPIQLIHSFDRSDFPLTEPRIFMGGGNGTPEYVAYRIGLNHFDSLWSFVDSSTIVAGLFCVQSWGPPDGFRYGETYFYRIVISNTDGVTLAQTTQSTSDDLMYEFEYVPPFGPLPLPAGYEHYRPYLPYWRFPGYYTSQYYTTLQQGDFDFFPPYHDPRQPQDPYPVTTEPTIISRRVHNLNYSGNLPYRPLVKTSPTEYASRFYWSDLFGQEWEVRTRLEVDGDVSVAGIIRPSLTQADLTAIGLHANTTIYKSSPPFDQPYLVSDLLAGEPWPTNYLFSGDLNSSYDQYVFWGIKAFKNEQ